MSLWKDQTPGDTILSFSQSLFDGRYTFEIDRLAPRLTPAMYRLTIGTLFEYREIERSDDLLTIITKLQAILQAPTRRAASKLINAA